jgi:hypothetical protein
MLACAHRQHPPQTHRAHHITYITDGPTPPNPTERAPEISDLLTSMVTALSAAAAAATAAAAAAAADKLGVRVTDSLALPPQLDRTAETELRPLQLQLPYHWQPSSTKRPDHRRRFIVDGENDRRGRPLADPPSSTYGWRTLVRRTGLKTRRRPPARRSLL